MVNKYKKRILFIAVLVLALGSLLVLSDNLFMSATEDKNTNIEVYTQSGDIPAAVRNFEMNLKHSDNAQMLEHYDIRGKGKYNNIFGYVQIWKTDDSLEHYMKISKEYMSMNVFGFCEGEIKVNGKKWKKWEYIVNSTAVSQGFYEKDGKIYLCGICVPYQEKTIAFDKIFAELLGTVIS